MTKTPKSVKTVIVEAGAFGELPIHILDNGQRVIEEKDMVRFVKYLEAGGEMTSEIAAELEAGIKGIEA